MAQPNDAVQSISGPDPDLQSARLAAIAQSPDAQERNAPAEHPMVSYARGLLSPLNYPEAPFLNDQPTPSFGNTERADMVQPYQPYTPGPFDFQGSNQGPAGQTGYDVTKAISQIPVVGGAMNYLTNQIDPSRGARVTRSLMTNPSDEATQAEALGLISGGLSIEGQAGKAALSARLAKGAQGADQSAIAAKLAEASGAGLTKDAGRAVSDAADAAAGRVPTADVSTAMPSAAEQQAAFGITPQIQIQAALTQIPAPVAEAVRVTSRTLGVDAQGMTQIPGMRAHLDSALSTAHMATSDENALSLAQALLEREKVRPTRGNAAARATVTAGAPGGATTDEVANLAKLAMDAGASPKEVQQLLGSQVPEVQQRLAGLRDEMGGGPPKPPTAESGPPIPPNEGPSVTGKTTLFPEKDIQATIQRKFTPATAAQVVTQAMYNSIVFPTTNLVHSFGSSASSLANFPERVLLSGVDSALHRIGLTKQRNFTLDGSVAGLNAQLHGIAGSLAHDLPGTIIDGTNKLVDQDVPAETAAAILRGEYGSSVGIKALGALGQVAGMGGYPLRVIAGVDNAIVKGLTNARLAERGYVEGTNLGLRGQELHDYAQNFMNNASADALEQAITDAKTQINRQGPGTIGAGILKAKGATGPIGTVLLPFFNTKLNILKAATTWSPLGFARLIPSDIPVLGYFGRNTTSEAARIQAITRAGLGTLVIYPIWQQVLSDNITGDGPTDPKQRAIWAGDPSNPSHVERAIRMPFGWVTYGKVPVLGDYLAAIADTAQAVRDGRESDVSGAQAAFAGLVQYFAKEEQGLGDAAATISALYQGATRPQDAQAQAELAQQLASRGFEITPYSGAMRAYETVNDPNYRRLTPGTSGLGARTLGDYQAQIPGWNQSLPAGAPRVPGVTGGVGALAPVRVSGETSGPVSETASGLPPVASQESDRLAKLVPDFKPLALPNNKIGQGTKQELPLSGGEYLTFARYVGAERQNAVNALLLRSDYQNAAPGAQARMFTTAVNQANQDAEAKYLATGVIKSDDPQLATQEAVLGFHVQGSEKERAYWVALLDRAGRLTSEVAAAIDKSQPATLPGQTPPLSVSQYQKVAPLVHEYLAHVPFGTDAHPIGTAPDWTAVADAIQRRDTLSTELQRQGVFKSVAEARAQAEVLKTLTSTVQRNLFLNGAQLENPARKVLALRNPIIGRIVSAKQPNESQDAYQNFPFGAP